MAKKKSKSKDPPAETEDGQLEAKPKGGLVPKLAMVIALGVVSFGTVYLLPRPDTSSHTTEASSDTAHHEEEIPPLELAQNTNYLELTPLTVSLQKNSRVLKIGITLEVLSGEEEYIDPNDPKIRDAFMGYLRALRLEQIEDAAFMAQMRAQLLRRAQLILGQDKVHGILITDFLVR